MGSLWDSFIDGYNNPGGVPAPAAEAPSESEKPMTAWDSLMQSQQRPRARDNSRYQPDDMFTQGIVEAAEELGVDAVDLATAISYETGGTFDPQQKGPTTKWGQHEGLIQFGQPQQQEYGVDLSSRESALHSQLGADGAIVKYLRRTGVQPGMGLLDIYSAINAGGVGRYDRSDAHAGGAPGTVRDKVENQMAGHRENAMQLLGVQSEPRPTRNRLWLDF